MVISEGTCVLRGVSSEGLPGLSQHHVCALTSVRGRAEVPGSLFVLHQVRY